MSTASDVRSITEAWVRSIAPDARTARPAELPPGVDRARFWDTSLKGFGAVVGRRGVTFIARYRVDGARRNHTIGTWGRVGAGEAGDQIWTVERARREAMKILGTRPTADAPRTGEGPTLEEGLAMHVARMRKKRAADSSISTIEKGVRRYLGDWLDTPITRITGEMLIARHEQIKSKARAITGANPDNPKGAAAANRTITQFSAIWSTVNKAQSGALGTWNPAKAVDKDRLAPKRETLADLPRWWRDVQALGAPREEGGHNFPVGRDGLIVALFTGLRHEDVRTIRWEHVDLEARTLHLPDPKGGAERAFTIPISRTVIEVLKRRRADNPGRTMGDDGGWAFPCVVLDEDGTERAAPISDLRKQLHGESHARFPAEDVHTLRRTFISIAAAEGVSDIDQRVLSNHRFASGDVHEIYVKQHLDDLRRAVDRIEAGIRRRIGLEVTRGRRSRRAA